MKKPEKIIVHVDMDAFFAAIEMRDFPQYRNKAVVVGADPHGGKGRGVVSTASYEARVYGIHSAQPISQAFRACPDAIFVRPRFSAYQQASEKVMETLNEFSPFLEPLSIDEAFLDCTETIHLFGSVQKLGKSIKNRILEETQITCSVGIASCKFVAKVASDLNKPDAITICENGKEAEFLAPLPITRLWGVGKKTAARLEAMGYKLIGDVAAVRPDKLEKIFGKWGEKMCSLARGIDAREVVTGSKRKSISEETTFAKDVSKQEQLESTLRKIADHLSRNMRKKKLIAKTITLKIRLSGFHTFTRSETISEKTNDRLLIEKITITLLRKFDRQHKSVRLIGIALSNLSILDDVTTTQMKLFTEQNQKSADKKNEKLIDELKEKYGDIISRGSLLPH